METHTEMALATSVENQPNVRIVNFYFDPGTKTLYFATFKENDKVREIRVNSKVSFTTIPKYGNEHVKAKGIASKSKLSIFDLSDFFIKKIPDYRETIEYAGESLIVYEIRYDEAVVTLNLDNIKKIKL